MHRRGQWHPGIIREGGVGLLPSANSPEPTQEPSSWAIPLVSLSSHFCHISHSNPSVLAGQAELSIPALLTSRDDIVKGSVLYSSNPIYQVCGLRLKSLSLRGRFQLSNFHPTSLLPLQISWISTLKRFLSNLVLGAHLINF